MKASDGSFTHESIMRLTWRQFHVYLDAFTWAVQEETEEGQKKNRRYDHRATAGDTRLKSWKQTEIERANRALAGIRKRQQSRVE